VIAANPIFGVLARICVEPVSFRSMSESSFPGRLLSGFRSRIRSAAKVPSNLERAGEDPLLSEKGRCRLEIIRPETGNPSFIPRCAALTDGCASGSPGVPGVF